MFDVLICYNVGSNYNIEKSKKAWIKEQEELQKLFNKTNSNNVDIEILNFNRIDVKTKQNSDISMFLED